MISDTPRIRTMWCWDSRQPVQCSGTARVYDSGSHLLSTSEEQGTNPKDKKKKVSDQEERLVNTEGKKNQDEKQPFGRDHKNNVFLENLK